MGSGLGAPSEAQAQGKLVSKRQTNHPFTPGLLLG